MKNVATQVMVMVNAPYGTDLSAHQLAAMIIDLESASAFSAPVFAFFSEVPSGVQKEFLNAMSVDQMKASKVAEHLAKLSGYTLPPVN